MQMRGTKAGDSHTVLGELGAPAGAIARGERVPRGNYELYGLLLDIEKKELETYYLRKLAEARKTWPELEREFTQVLAA
jgi:hypothetical protein